MALILPIFSNTFCLKKNFTLWFQSHWSLFLWSNWQLVSIGSDNGLVLIWHQAITWTNVDTDFWSLVLSLGHNELTHWGQVNWIIIGSDNGLLPVRHQAITQTNADLSSIEPLGTNFSEILITIQTFSLKKMHLQMSSEKCQPSCLGFNVLNMGTLNLTSYPGSMLRNHRYGPSQCETLLHCDNVSHWLGPYLT